MTASALCTSSSSCWYVCMNRLLVGLDCVVELACHDLLELDFVGWWSQKTCLVGLGLSGLVAARTLEQVLNAGGAFGKWMDAVRCVRLC